MADFRISNEVGASVFAVLSGLTALFLTAWIFGAGGCSSPPNPQISSDSAELTKLKAALAEKSDRLAEANAKLKDSQEVTKALSAKASALQAKWKDADVDGLKIDIKNLEAKLKESANRQDAMKARFSVGTTELKGRISSLEQKLNTLGEEKIALVAKASKHSGKNADELTEQLQALQGQLQKEQKDCASAKAALQKQIDELRSSLDQAEYGEQLKRAVDFPALDLPLLVNDPAKLNPAVRPLFIRLRSMGDTPQDREKLYAELGKEGKTKPLHLVPFASGSAEIVDAEQKKLEGQLTSVEKGAKYLVVGYASTDGEAKANYELSSNRASIVAQLVASLAKAGGDSVQAVYFGQTKRFSAIDLPPNRVVEVWQVK